MMMLTLSLPSNKGDSLRVTPWLKYCDRHPNCYRDPLSDYAQKFNQEEYHCIDQLTSNWVSVEKLASWVKIGTGIAELVIRYTSKDMLLVNVGQFLMMLPGDGHNANDSEE